MTSPAVSAFAFQNVINSWPELNDQHFTNWPRIGTYYSYETKLHFSRPTTIRGIPILDYWIHLKVDSENERLSIQVYDDEDFSVFANGFYNNYQNLQFYKTTAGMGVNGGVKCDFY